MNFMGKTMTEEEHFEPRRAKEGQYLVMGDDVRLTTMCEWGKTEEELMEMHERTDLWLQLTPEEERELNKYI